MAHRRVELHAVEAKGSVARQVDDPRIGVSHLGCHRRGQGGAQHAQAGDVAPFLGHLGRQQGPSEVAVVAAIKGEEVVGTQHGLQGLVDVHGVHGSFRYGQTLGPFCLGGAGGPQLLQPGQVLPGMLRRLGRQLLHYAGHVAHHAHSHAPVAAYLGGRRVDLDNPGVGGHVGGTAETDGVVLLPAKEHHHVGVAQHGGRPIQAPFKESEAVGMVVGYQAPGLAFRQHGHFQGFRKIHQRLSILGVPCRLSGDDEGPLGLAQQGDCLLNLGLGRQDGLAGPVFVGIEEGHLFLVQLLFLHVRGNGQVHRSAPAAECQAHRAGDGVGDAAGVVDHQGLLGGGRRHAHLVDFLHGAPAQF